LRPARGRAPTCCAARGRYTPWRRARKQRRDVTSSLVPLLPVITPGIVPGNVPMIVPRGSPGVGARIVERWTIDGERVGGLLGEVLHGEAAAARDEPQRDGGGGVGGRGTPRHACPLARTMRRPTRRPVHVHPLGRTSACARPARDFQYAVIS